MRATETMMGALVSHPTGNANVRAALRGLHRANLLQEFHTTLAVPHSCLTTPLLTGTTTKQLRRRYFPEAPWHRTKIHPWPELLRQIAPSLGLSALTRSEASAASVDSVYRQLDREVATRIIRNSTDFSCVYSYEDGAFSSFAAAKKSNITCFYELPIAHWRTLDSLLREESELWPEWAATLAGIDDSEQKRDRKDAEIMAADKVIVPSSFVKKSVVNAFPEKEQSITVVPFGCPKPALKQPLQRVPDQPLRVLFAGQLTQRKGLAYLAAALDKIEVDWHLSVAGPKPPLQSNGLEELLSRRQCSWLGRIPHDQLLAEMAKAHVFVFPSIVEGFALVIPEAMSCGLPIITTPNSGADILTEGRDGFVVPIRDPDALADRITRLADDETLRLEMSANALRTAATSPWSVYEDRVATLVSGDISR